MDILGCEFRLPFTSPLWIVHWKSKALQKRLSNQYTCSTLLSCHASEGVTSLIPSKKGEIEKSINWNCLPNEFLHCVRVGIWKLVIRVTVRMNGLFGDNIQKLKIAWLRQDFPKQNHVQPSAMRADCSFERSHFLITLTSSLYYLFLQIPAEQQNCTSSTWNIFKS